jgi:N-acyl-L-homoserine lactone synthetase
LQRYFDVGFTRKDEADPYVEHSIYFIAKKESLMEIVGTTRLIFKHLDELPTIKYFEINEMEKDKLAQLEPDQYAEVSALTKMPQYDVTLGLIGLVVQYSLAKGISHLICCIDERVYNYLDKVSHLPFKIIGTKKVYLGSVCIPCAINLSEYLAVLKEKKYAIYQYLFPNSDKNTEVIL